MIPVHTASVQEDSLDVEAIWSLSSHTVYEILANMIAVSRTFVFLSKWQFHPADRKQLARFFYFGFNINPPEARDYYVNLNKPFLGIRITTK